MADLIGPIAPTTTPEQVRCHFRPLFADRTTFLLLAGILLVSGEFQLHSLLHHDPAWLIHGTEVFLDGGRLYRDVFELNPPLIFYLTVPPVWLARTLHLFDVDVFVVYVFVLISVSLWFGWLVWRDGAVLPARVRNSVLLAAAVALAVCPAGNFGQREHLMMVLSLPYMLLATRRARLLACNPWLAGAIGLMAALGFALKPHFLLIPFAAESYIALRTGTLRRILRAETIVLGLAVLVYLEAIAWFTPDYLTMIVPFGMAVYEGGFDSPLLTVLACPSTLLLPLLLMLHGAIRRHLDIPEAGDLLCIAASCFFLIYILQMKGWSYQAYPLDATLFLGLALVLVQSAAMPGMARLAFAVSALLVAVAVNDGAQRYRNPFMAEMAPLVAALPTRCIYLCLHGKGVRGLSAGELHWRRLVVALRYFLVAAWTARPARPHREIEQFLRDAVAADLTRRPPALIFVDVAPRKVYFGDRSFDYIRYFSNDPRFVAIWADYQPLARIGHFIVYRQRTPLGTS